MRPRPGPIPTSASPTGCASTPSGCAASDGPARVGVGPAPPSTAARRPGRDWTGTAEPRRRGGPRGPAARAPASPERGRTAPAACWSNGSSAPVRPVAASPTSSWSAPPRSPRSDRGRSTPGRCPTSSCCGWPPASSRRTSSRAGCPDRPRSAGPGHGDATTVCTATPSSSSRPRTDLVARGRPPGGRARRARGPRDRPGPDARPPVDGAGLRGRDPGVAGLAAAAGAHRDPAAPDRPPPPGPHPGGSSRARPGSRRPRPEGAAVPGRRPARTRSAARARGRGPRPGPPDRLRGGPPRAGRPAAGAHAPDAAALVGRGAGQPPRRSPPSTTAGSATTPHASPTG